MKWPITPAAKRALVYIAFTIPVLGLLMMLGVLPAREQLSTAQQEKAELKAEIKRQEVFQPVYARIMQSKEKAEPSDITKEPPLGLEDAPSVDTVAQKASEMAAQSGLENIFFSPVPQSLDNDSSLLLVNGEMQGSLHSFREFLLRLAGTEAFEGLEGLEVHGTDSLPRYSLRLWVRL